VRKCNVYGGQTRFDLISGASIRGHLAFALLSRFIRGRMYVNFYSGIGSLILHFFRKYSSNVTMLETAAHEAGSILSLIQLRAALTGIIFIRSIHTKHVPPQHHINTRLGPKGTHVQLILKFLAHHRREIPPRHTKRMSQRRQLRRQRQQTWIRRPNTHFLSHIHIHFPISLPLPTQRNP